jgi:dephospho-CoA kinase
MFAGKPIIGIAGGIGSGKSYVARLFGELGCLVIDSDAQVRAAYDDERVKRALREWWGDAAFDSEGNVDRRFITRRVFSDPAERERLERLLHPLVNSARDALMKQAADDPQVVAYVWDTPLLFEAGLYRTCDAIVFVDAPLEARLARVKATRGWEETDLHRRQILQWALDKKREMSDHRVTNAADHAGDVREQVRATLSRILAGTSAVPVPRH